MSGMQRNERIERKKKDLVVIGGGPAGLAAAISAHEAGCHDILLIERDRMLGGILNQCIHDGFGLHRFKETLSGPEYAARYVDRVWKHGISVSLETIVIGMNEDRRLLISRRGCLEEIEARAIVLAMGCRERACGALSIPGDRPSGVYTAGTAQNLINMENIMPGRRVVVLGSGDIGLIMARRMTLEGAKVEAVFEILPYSSGLPRNIRQCLVDYGIPLFLSTTVVEIVGRSRLEGVRVAEVDADKRPISDSERFVPCDTLLLSVGLIPENELAREAGIALHPVTGGPIVNDLCMTSVPGIFSCGNALHVHDLVDWVSEEAARAGANAAKFVQEGALGGSEKCVEVIPGAGIRYVIPQRIAAGEDVSVAFRVVSPARNGRVEVISNGVVIKEERHPRLHPAEMIWIKLGKILPVDTDRLEVRVGG